MKLKVWGATLAICAGLLSMQGASRAETAGLNVPQHTQEAKRIRAWHFVLRHVSLERARWMVDLAQAAGFNTVVVQLADGVRFDQAPWTPLPSAWDKKDFKSWQIYVRSKGMELIPELQLLTHQEKFFQNNFPSLMYNAVSYNPSKREVYTRVHLLLDELIALTTPNAIHIGHDEVVGWNAQHAKKTLNSGEVMLPYELFLNDVLQIHKYLKQRDIETWMWGDMLISPDEFPTMLAKHLHGSEPGYGKTLRDKLPKDIVICDWHFFDEQKGFPSLAILQQEGFRVIGATWKKEQTIHDFSRYGAEHGAYGMMATTWFHVQRKEWEVLEKIIRNSGNIFEKDFPDAP